MMLIIGVTIILFVNVFQTEADTCTDNCSIKLIACSGKCRVLDLFDILICDYGCKSECVLCNAQCPDHSTRACK